MADKRSPRDGRIIENVGTYNPQTDPSTVSLKQDRLAYWIEKGARPTDSVLNLMKAESLDAAGRPLDGAAATK